MSDKTLIDRHLNTHETDLGQWNIVVFTALTTALLFYHISQVKSIEMKKSHAAIIAISIIFISLVFNMYSLYNFVTRTDILIKRFPNKNHKDKIRQSQVIYGITTSILAVVQIGITVNIVKHIKKYL